MKLDHWETIPPAERAATLNKLSDADVLRLARSRAKQRKSTVRTIVTAWVVNGYIKRPRMQRLLEADAATQPKRSP